MLFIKKPFLTISLLFFGFSTLIAQKTDFSNYQNLKSQGQIPKDVLTPSSTKYKGELNKINKNDSRKERKTKKRFYLESRFLIDDLLRSGYVLYNDPLSNYVTEVAGIVLKDDPTLLQKLRFYVIRSSDANAFTTDQGIILVTAGLLSQVENEAQLAFILSHEIAHFQHKHALDMFLEVDNIDRYASKRRILGKSTFDKKLLKSSYSRSLETEADKEGLERYLKTNYDLASLDGVFDVLLYSHLPFEDQHFTKSYFENKYLRFPANFELEKVREITIDDEDDDSGSSHPSIAKRREAVAKGIEGKENSGKTKFALTEARFQEIQQIARFEVSGFSLHQEEYYRAIYESWVLLQQYPNNIYLEKNILKGIYTSSKYRNSGSTYQVEVDSIEGELQGLVHFFEKFSNADLAVLTTQYAWKLHKAYPQDEEIKFMAEDALNELFFEYFDNLDNFSKEKAPEPTQTVVEEVKKEKPEPAEKAEEGKKKKRTKLEKLREKKGTSKDEKVSDVTKYALAPYLEDADFLKSVKAAQDNAKKRKEKKAYYETTKGKKEWSKKQARAAKKGRRLGMDKIVIVNPYYLNLDARKENSVEYIKSEYSQQDFQKLLMDNAKKCDLKVSMLDVESLKPSETEKFNDIALLNQWFAEQVNFEDLTITPGFRQAEINAMAKKYGTKSFCWTGVISLRERKKLWPYIGIIDPTLWPFVAAYAVKKEYDCLYYNMVYNVETGAYDAVKFSYFDADDSKSLLNLHTYDAFLQIKSK